MKQLEYIARIHTDFPTKFGIPRQAGLVNTKGTIVFEPEYRKEEALKGLEEYSHLWLIWEFSEAVRENWSPTVRPPRLGGNRRCGVFATRSPFRPNPIGLSCVKLLGIEKHPEKGMVIEVEGADLLDGTPIFDIKPYLPYADCVPDARGGFADRVKNYALEVEIPENLLLKLPEKQRECVREILAEDPRPSYQNDPDRVYGMEYAGYEIKFRVKDRILTVCEVEGGMKVKYYLAPLEGITTYIYRRAYHTHYRPMEKYFTPFLVPHTKKDFNTREKNDILPEHNPDMYLVPQILANDAKGFLDTVEKLKAYGYDEVNLNLGCPSKTVVSKGRGSGFLIHTEELDRFLDEIYSKADVKISIKTRIGKFDADEWAELLRIYNQYPVEELIVHPRVQQQFYKGHPDLDAFADAVRECKHPLCYNGDIFTPEDMEKLKSRFPETSCIMLGRGILRNPELTDIMESGERRIDAKKLRAFHDQIYQEYQEVSCGDKNVLFKMKELWCYLGTLFPDKEKQLKKIRKAEKLDRYEAVVEELLSHNYIELPRS